jgi:hypothetical protein
MERETEAGKAALLVSRTLFSYLFGKVHDALFDEMNRVYTVARLLLALAGCYPNQHLEQHQYCIWLRTQKTISYR